jgi:spore germination cell wall hydrolase CwlJ-like protein
MKVLLCLIATAASCLGATWEEKVVAAVIAGEARGEGRAGMVAVGEVIRQRCSERKQTPFQVVTARNEFTSKVGLTATEIVRRYGREDGYATALDVASMVCKYPNRLPGITHRANSFDSKTAKPWWARGHKPVAIIGNHAFYRIRN